MKRVKYYLHNKEIIKNGDFCDGYPKTFKITNNNDPDNSIGKQWRSRVHYPMWRWISTGKSIKGE